jgi:hypothetical protein
MSMFFLFEKYSISKGLTLHFIRDKSNIPGMLLWGSAEDSRKRSNELTSLCLSGVPPPMTMSFASLQASYSDHPLPRPSEAADDRRPRKPAAGNKR